MQSFGARERDLGLILDFHSSRTAETGGMFCLERADPSMAWDGIDHCGFSRRWGMQFYFCAREYRDAAGSILV